MLELPKDCSKYDDSKSPCNNHHHYCWNKIKHFHLTPWTQMLPKWKSFWTMERMRRKTVSNKLFLRKEKHEKYEKSLSFVEGETRERWEEPMFGKRLRQETSEPASEGGWREASRSYKRERAGSFTGRSFDREGQRAVTVARPLDVVTLWNRTPVSVTAHSSSLLFPFHNKKNPNNDYPVPLTVHPNSWPHSGMNGKDWFQNQPSLLATDLNFNSM